MGHEHVIPEFAVRMLDLITATMVPFGSELANPQPLPFRIQGSGQETRSFCFISDCIDALMVLLDKGEDRNVYHLGNPGEEHSISVLAHAVAEWFGQEIHVMPGKLPKGSPTRRLPDISKLAALGYEPNVTLGDGLTPTLSWYQQEADAMRVAA
jgi:nucleoside-diphosphate-sugar epimerase